MSNKYAKRSTHEAPTRTAPTRPAQDPLRHSSHKAQFDTPLRTELDRKRSFVGARLDAKFCQSSPENEVWRRARQGSKFSPGRRNKLKSRKTLGNRIGAKVEKRSHRAQATAPRSEAPRHSGGCRGGGSDPRHGRGVPSEGFANSARQIERKNGIRDAHPRKASAIQTSHHSEAW